VLLKSVSARLKERQRAVYGDIIPKGRSLLSTAMVAEHSATLQVDLRLISRIVGNYVKHHKIRVEQLGGLIAEVHRTLGSLGRVVSPEETRVPAVPIRRSVRPDYVVCLDCGLRGKMLRRHIREVHGLDPAAYRARWNLAMDHPLTAPSYAAQRSTFAKEIGLGARRRRVDVSSVAAPAEALDPVFAASLSTRPRRTRRSRSAPVA
jgi:predicted transcriptional regulator